MARPRTDLHDILKGLDGVEAAYFQPKQNTSLTYPCIVYSRDNSYAARADDVLYWHKKRYQVTVIDRNPDGPIPDQVERLPLTRFDRFYVADGLNHYSYILFF